MKIAFVPSVENARAFKASRESFTKGPAMAEGTETTTCKERNRKVVRKCTGGVSDTYCTRRSSVQISSWPLATGGLVGHDFQRLWTAFPHPMARKHLMAFVLLSRSGAVQYTTTRRPPDV